MIRLLVSYSGKDRAAVQELITDLRQAHLSVWHDQALLGGELWWQDILRRIRECDVFLFALSKNSLADRPCLTELSYARALGLPVLPVQVGPVGNLRTTPVADIQVVDYQARTLASGLALLDAIQNAVSGRRPSPDPPPEPPPAPFGYLRLGSALAAAQLTPDEQGAFIRQLREAVETEHEEGVREDVRELLLALRHRPDITYRNAAAVDGLLADIGASEPREVQVQGGRVHSEPGMASPTANGPIFVVHGRDHAILHYVVRVLQQVTEREVIVLHERANEGRTILEKFEDYATEAAYAVVLLTGDDEGGIAGDPTRSRGRQNVIFELGFFFGKLGRQRVTVLLGDDVERPSDIDGLVYIDLDTRGGWKQSLCKELEEASVDVNYSRIP